MVKNERAKQPALDQRAVRGDDTRERLIVAGIRVFGAHGYDGVTTRALAEAASVNQAAILYHFGGKQALYMAVAEYIAARGRDFLSALLHQSDTHSSPAERLQVTLHALVRGLLGVGSDTGAAGFILREQTQPTAAFEVLYEGYIRAVHERITGIIAKATHRSPTSPDVIIDAHGIVGMALSFAVASETFLRRVEWEKYTAERVEQIAARVAAMAARALGLDPRLASLSPTAT